MQQEFRVADIESQPQKAHTPSYRMFDKADISFAGSHSPTVGACLRLWLNSRRSNGLESFSTLRRKTMLQD